MDHGCTGQRSQESQSTSPLGPGAPGPKIYLNFFRISSFFLLEFLGCPKRSLGSPAPTSGTAGQEFVANRYKHCADRLGDLVMRCSGLSFGSFRACYLFVLARRWLVVARCWLVVGSPQAVEPCGIAFGGSLLHLVRCSSSMSSLNRV